MEYMVYCFKMGSIYPWINQIEIFKVHETFIFSSTAGSAMKALVLPNSGVLFSFVSDGVFIIYISRVLSFVITSPDYVTLPKSGYLPNMKQRPCPHNT